MCLVNTNFATCLNASKRRALDLKVLPIVRTNDNTSPRQMDVEAAFGKRGCPTAIEKIPAGPRPKPDSRRRKKLNFNLGLSTPGMLLSSNSRIPKSHPHLTSPHGLSWRIKL
jgi:hypothetical protein